MVFMNYLTIVLCALCVCLRAVLRLVINGLRFIGGSDSGMQPGNTPHSVPSSCGDGREQSVDSGLPSVSLPVFSGGNVQQYFRQVRLVQHANGWEESLLLRILPAHLSGPALACYEVMPTQDKGSLDSMEKYLIKSFTGRSATLANFNRLAYSSSQTVEEYLLSLHQSLDAVNIDLSYDARGSHCRFLCDPIAARTAVDRSSGAEREVIGLKVLRISNMLDISR